MTLKQIKKMLGRGCTYLSFSKERLFDNDNQEWVRVNSIKVKYLGDTVIMPVYKEQSDLVLEDYKEIFHSIVNQKWKQN